MAFLCQTPDPTPQVQTQQLPAWYENAIQGLIGAGGAAVAASPYEYYDPTKRVAPLTEGEKQAMAMLPEAAGSYMPALTKAYESAGTATTPFYEMDISKYMSPYQQAVVDVEKREALRDYEKMLPQGGFAATQRGAFGGARHGVMEAEAQRNLMQRLGDIQTKGSQAAFTAGTDLMNRDLGRAMEGAGVYKGIGESAQKLGIGGLQAILNAQGVARGIEGQLRDKTYEEEMRRQGYTMNQLQQLSGLMRGIQPPTTTTTTGGAAQASPLSNLAGLGLAGISGYKLWNLLP